MWIGVIGVVEKDELIKSRFRSRSEHTLDPKGRFNFPRRFKDVLQEYYGSSGLMLTTWGTCLRAYPASEWQIIEDKLLSKGREEPNLARFIRHVVSGITECSLDKQSRLLIPSSLRSEVGIGKEITLTGMLEFIEIWDKRSWQTEYELARKNLEQYNNSLANIGIL